MVVARDLNHVYTPHIYASLRTADLLTARRLRSDYPAPRTDPRCNPDTVIYPRIESTAPDDRYPVSDMSGHARAGGGRIRIRTQRQMGLRALSTRLSLR